MGMDGLSCSSIIRKLPSWPKLTCMIDADLVAVGHVSSSHWLGRMLHEVIIFTTRAAPLRGVHGGMRESGVRRKMCVARL